VAENSIIRLHNASQITLRATVRYADGNLVDLNGFAFRWVMVAAASQDTVAPPALVTLTSAGGGIVVTDAAAGEVEVRIPNGSFDGLTGVHRWQLIATDASSNEWVVSTGPMHFWPTA